MNHLSAITEKEQNRGDDVHHLGESSKRDLRQHLLRLLRVRRPVLPTHGRQNDSRIDGVDANAARALGV